MQVASKLCFPVAPHVTLCIHLGSDFVDCFVFMQKTFMQTDLNKSRREFRCESLVSAEAGNR